MARCKPRSDPRTLVVAAHLDTVFPAGTDLKVRQNGKRYTGPGLTGGSLGLASQLAIIKALDRGAIATYKTILFLGNCCEEGLGDLLGVKHLFNDSPHKGKIDAFISIDGVNPARIVNGALASKRYRVTIKGPGGHSYGNFGRVSPMHALGRAMDYFATIVVPEKPKTTYNIGKIGGGTSINAIAFEAWMEVDMRSESDRELDKMEQHLLASVRRGVDEENKFRAKSGAKLVAEPKLLATRYGGFYSGIGGYRPGGQMGGWRDGAQARAGDFEHRFQPTDKSQYPSRDSRRRRRGRKRARARRMVRTRGRMERPPATAADDTRL